MNLTKELFEQKIQEKFTGVVDFYAEWCGPCKAMSPMLDKLNEELGSEIIYKIDIEKEKAIAKEYEIRSVPTLVFFKDGEPVNRIIGATSKKSILEALNS